MVLPVTLRHAKIVSAMNNPRKFCTSKIWPYTVAVFFVSSKIRSFRSLTAQNEYFPHDQRTCVGVWCMCARKGRKLN